MKANLCRARRGALLLEMVTTLGLLIALLVLVAPAARRLTSLQRSSETRSQAQRACSAALTLVVSRPWSEIREELANDPMIAESVAENCPGGTFKLEVSENSDQSKQIAAIVEWPVPGPDLAQWRLVTWRYQDAELSP